MKELEQYKNYIVAHNELGEVRTRRPIDNNITEDFSYIYDLELPFLKDIIASYFIFDYWSKTTVVFMVDGVRNEIIFNTLEEMRQFYIFET